jgi:SOUL heme-binding protein
MKTIYSHLSFFTAVLLAIPMFNPASASDLPSDKYEQPRYKVVESVGTIEIRRYEPMLMAEVDVDGDRSTAAGRGFRVLAGYIFGGNAGQKEVAMTSPVTQAPAPAEGAKIAMTSPVTMTPTSPQAGAKIAMTSPVTMAPTQADAKESPNRWTFAFMMPAKFTLETLPKPNNPSIRFLVRPGETRAVVRFSGISSEGNLSEHREKLLTFVAQRQLKTTGEPVLALYDDPFTLPWNRRNEWWIAVQPS